MSKYIGRTVVVGKFLGADDTTAKFDINNQIFDIGAIEDQGDFVSPLNRLDEFNEPRTMKEYLMHPRKSAKRKLKKGDFVLLTLQRYLNDDKKIEFKIQNVITFIRHLNVEDELEYRGIVVHADDVQRFYKSDENLPLYSIKFSSAKKDNKTMIETVSKVLDNGITLKMNFVYKDGDNFTKKILIKDEKSFKNKIFDELTDDDKKEYIYLKDFEEFIKKDQELIYTISFFQNGTKQKEITGKYEKIFLNNAKTKTPKSELEKLLNEDIEAYYSHRKVQMDGDNFTEREVFGKLIGENGNTIMAPSVIAFKESRDSHDENISFFLVSSIVPDIISMRKRAFDYMKSQLEKSKEMEGEA